MTHVSPPLAVDARGVNKRFGTGALAFQALSDVDFQVARGELVMLVGPSGSGKTTLLSILGCVLQASSGAVRLFGHDVAGLRERDLPAVRAARRQEAQTMRCRRSPCSGRGYFTAQS